MIDDDHHTLGPRGPLLHIGVLVALQSTQNLFVDSFIVILIRIRLILRLSIREREREKDEVKWAVDEWKLGFKLDWGDQRSRRSDQLEQ